MSDRRIIDLAVLSASPPGPILSWSVGDGPVGGVAIDERAGVIATGNNRGHVAVVDLATGRHRAGFRTDGWVWSLAFSPDHRLLTAVGLDGSMWCWEWETGRRLVDGVIPGVQAQNGRPWLSDCGSRMAMMKPEGLMVWDVLDVARRLVTAPVGTSGEAAAFDEATEHVFFAAGTSTMGKVVPSDMIRKVNGGLQILGPDEIITFPLDLEEARRNRMWRIADGAPIDLPEALGHHPMGLVSIVGDRQLVTGRQRCIESFDLITGNRIGPMVVLPEHTQRIEARGDLVAVLGNGWLVLNWRTGELVAGRRAPKAAPRRASTAATSARAPGRTGGTRRRRKPPVMGQQPPHPMRIRLSLSGTHVAVSSSPGLVEVFEVEGHRPVAS